MATWISHMMVADAILNRGLDLNPRGFCVGNIAPDCNIKDETFSVLTPSREVTHFMTGPSKLTADYRGFYHKYIEGRCFSSKEEESFLFGYYSHLITDVEFLKFVREEARVQKTFARIKEKSELFEQVKPYPEDFDTIKKVFGRSHVFFDITVQELDYLNRNPNSVFHTVLIKIKDFPEYIDILPHGAIRQNLEMMPKVPTEKIPIGELVFFPKQEYESFIKRTSNFVYERIQNPNV